MGTRGKRVNMGDGEQLGWGREGDEEQVECGEQMGHGVTWEMDTRWRLR